MAEVSLTQQVADALVEVEKHRADDDKREYPNLGGAISVPLVSADKREHFLLDIGRGSISLAKVTNQLRARQVVVLVRLDLGGSPHRNPDGEEMSCPHLHVYREGYGDKWALPVPADCFSDTNDAWKALEDFMRYCNIIQQPWIERGVFA